MSQNIAAVHFDDTQWAAMDQALTALEQASAPILVSLDGARGRRKLLKMGDGSEAFCRKALDAMRENRGLLPDNLDLEEMARDLADHDALNARLTRALQLVERMRDTDTALGSDVMVAAVLGFQVLRLAGKGQGLDGTNNELGKRFGPKGRRARDEEPEPREA
ncbi:hypothetical protein [Agrilutibacter solisilvae]|uniref:Uncharacterized protein n=1 Tax=Agrilutibacter solisilvae TaxID=2763317 RepID=A0A975ATY6_9GAMM|nr:hypothetical protein [Lysobacter solisilvae]QSX79659.1 hypothetical protein I8J32_007395 [Lysobacter solisilvae]